MNLTALIISYFVNTSKAILLVLFIALSGCSFRHIGCTCLYNGEQVELIKYEGKGMYKVRPLSDTTWTLHVNEIDLQ